MTLPWKWNDLELQINKYDTSIASKLVTLNPQNAIKWLPLLALNHAGELRSCNVPPIPVVGSFIYLKPRINYWAWTTVGRQNEFNEGKTRHIMRAKERLSESFSYKSTSTKVVGGRGYATDPVRGTYDAPSDCLFQSFVNSTDKNSSGDEIANVNFYAVRPEATRIRWNNTK